MVNKNRIEGGVTNKKSGQVWNRKELELVFDLYLELNGEKIHETNPKIIELGEKIGRTTRSVEAQLLMFKSLVMDKESSYKNMNKLVKKIWNEFEQKMKKDTHRGWAGHREEGVSVAFTEFVKKDSDIVKTRLLRELSKLTSYIKSKDNSVRKAVAIFLLGGPGNGKTQALDYFVKDLSEKIGQGDNIYKRLKEKSVSYNRSIDLNLDKITSGKLSAMKIIQDASVGTDSQKAHECLIDDIKWIINSEPGALYFSCINRGILQDAIQSYIVDELDNESSYLLSTISNSLTAKIPENTWPLKFKDREDLEVYIWPMERDDLSLPVSNKESSPIEQSIKLYFDSLVKSENNQNIVDWSLKEEESISSLLKLIKAFQIKSGSNLSMRAWFSLLVLAIEGFEEEIKYNSTWDKALNQYTSRIFPLYPDISKIINTHGIKKVFEADNSRTVEKFFKSYDKAIPNYQESEIYELLVELEKELETARSWSFEMLIPNSDFKPREFDRYLSTSLEAATEYLSGLKSNLNLTEIDFSLFKEFSSVEKTLNSLEDQNKSIWNEISHSLTLLKKLYSIYAYRNISVRSGKTIHTRLIEKFISLCENENEELKRDVSSTIENSITSNDRLVIDMYKTFGQPLESSEKGLRLEVNSDIRIKFADLDDGSIKQPLDKKPTIKILFGDTYSLMTLSYKLFEAIQLQSIGLKSAMISREVHAQLERISTEIGQDYLKKFKDSGYKNVRISNSRDRNENNLDVEALVYELKKLDKK